VPELPEVEYVRRRLQRVMNGARITRVELRRADLRGPFPADFVRRIEGQTVLRVSRRAKYLVAELASGDALVMHLGMSGSFRIESGGSVRTPGRFRYDRSEDDRHDHVVFDLSSGVRVIFNDPRRFGSMTIVPAGDAAQPPTRDLRRKPSALEMLGPEPLARAFDAPRLAASLAGKKTSLKAALSDQRVVAGLGNIYVSEALHEAGLSPRRRAGTLVTPGGQPRERLVALVDAIRHVLKAAIRRQARYRGDEDPFRAYDREGQRCLRRGCPGTIRRIVQNGRSTFYCPVCQK
jgi:formamidopyrimidine-DNA glycosylase